jgi:uncharacterized protein YukE
MGWGTIGTKVTPEQLQQVSTQVSAGASNVDGILAQLASSVAPLGWANHASTEQSIASFFGR